MNDLRNPKIIGFLRLYLFIALSYPPLHMAVLAHEGQGFSLYYILFAISMLSVIAIFANLNVVVMGKDKQ